MYIYILVAILTVFAVLPSSYGEDHLISQVDIFTEVWVQRTDDVSLPYPVRQKLLSSLFPLNSRQEKIKAREDFENKLQIIFRENSRILTQTCSSLPFPYRRLLHQRLTSLSAEKIMSQNPTGNLTRNELKTIDSLTQSFNCRLSGHYRVGGLKNIKQICSTTSPYEHQVTLPCLNPEPPDLPSILRFLNSPYRNQKSARSLMTVAPLDQNGKIYNEDIPIVLPFGDPSNDGRLIRGSLFGLQVFIPEALDEDFTTKPGKKIVSNNIHWDPGGGQFRLFLTDQTKIDLRETNGNVHFAPHQSYRLDRHQASLCDPSNSEILSSKTKNPRFCQAKIISESSEYTKGDCYNIALFERIDQIRRRDNLITQQELWSFQFTVFVPHAKSAQTGRPYYFPANNYQKIPWHHSDVEYIFWRWETGQDQYADNKIAEFKQKGTPFPAKKDIAHKANFVFNKILHPRLGDNLSTPPQNLLYGETCENCFFWDGTNRGNRHIFEPDFTGDGHLMILNSMNTLAGIVYSYNPHGDCRADRFQTFKPISYFPTDPLVKDKYGLGKFGLFRTPTGRKIPAGEVVEGTYPWIDREGSLMTVALRTEGARNLYLARKKDPSSRLLSDHRSYSGHELTESILSQESFNEELVDNEIANHNVIFGLWTKGKMVYLDSILNPGQFSGRHYWEEGEIKSTAYKLPLYKGPSYHFQVIRPTMIQSVEKVFNHFPALRPTLPFDVVWRFQTNGGMNAEIAFDDYFRDDLLVYLSGRPVLEVVNESGQGDVRVKDGSSVTGRTERLWPHHLQYQFNEWPKLQNAATSDIHSRQRNVVSPPSHATLYGGARIEPIADGGIIGKGIFLDGIDDFIELGPFPPQRNLIGITGYILMLWIDLRSSEKRTLWSFNNGSEVLLSPESIVFKSQNGNEFSVDLPPYFKNSHRYHHITLLHDDSSLGKRFDLLVNGNHWDTIFLGNQFLPSDFNLFPQGLHLRGNLLLGSSQKKPIKAWIDEIKIFLLPGSGGFNKETLCNHALGTIVEIRSDDISRHDSLGDIAREAKTNYEISKGYFCEQINFGEWSEDIKAYTYLGPTDISSQRKHGVCIGHVHNPGNYPLKERCLRKEILAPELIELSPFSPRADSQQNLFCLSCHGQESMSHIPSLNLEALAGYHHLPSYLDPRRTPLSPLMASYGLPSHSFSFLEEFLEKFKADLSSHADESSIGPEFIWPHDLLSN